MFIFLSILCYVRLIELSHTLESKNLNEDNILQKEFGFNDYITPSSCLFYFEQAIFPHFEIIISSKLNLDETYYLIKCKYTADLFTIVVDIKNPDKYKIEIYNLYLFLMDCEENIKDKFVKDKIKYDELKVALNSIKFPVLFKKIIYMFQEDLKNTLRLFSFLNNQTIDENFSEKLDDDDLSFSLQYLNMINVCELFFSNFNNKQELVFDYDKSFADIKKKVKSICKQHSTLQFKNKNLTYYKLFNAELYRLARIFVRKYNFSNLELFTYTFKLIQNDEDKILQYCALFGLGNLWNHSHDKLPLKNMRIIYIMFLTFINNKFKNFKLINEKIKLRKFLYFLVNVMETTYRIKKINNLHFKYTNTFLSKNFDKIYQDIHKDEKYALLKMYVFCFYVGNRNHNINFLLNLNSDVELSLLNILFEEINKVKYKLFNLKIK